MSDKMGNFVRWPGKELLLWTKAKGNLAAKPEEKVGILKMRFREGSLQGTFAPFLREPWAEIWINDLMWIDR